MSRKRAPREWRNWQTRKIQVLVHVSVWRFKSSLPHPQSKPLESQGFLFSLYHFWLRRRVVWIHHPVANATRFATRLLIMVRLNFTRPLTGIGSAILAQ